MSASSASKCTEEFTMSIYRFTQFRRHLLTGIGAFAVIIGVGCGDDEVIPFAPDAGNGGDPDASTAGPPTSYEFASQFSSGSSVNYSGQVFRQTLIAGLKAEMGSWTALLDGANPPVRTQAEWIEELDFFFHFDPNTSLDQPVDLGLELPTLQQTWSEISDGADLVSKLAGNDDVTDHRDWDGDGEPVGATGSFVGWTTGAADSPEELIDLWFATAAQLAVQRAGGPALDPFGNQIEEAFITSSGLDLQQLVQKFLIGALTFSQGSDDYLDSGTANKGLESSNLLNDDNPYSTLEHTWDESFGYFGALRGYGDQTDAQNADPGYADSNSDGKIDLKSEHSSGMALNAAKRDRDSQPSAATDFTGDFFVPAINGRYLISQNAGTELTGAQRTELDGYRDQMIATWERVFGATSIHYINEIALEMAKINDGSGTYSFTTHAKVWSELKGFALAFQFNPRSSVTDADFAMLHTLIGDAPVVSGNQVALDAYATNLMMARDILAASFSFESVNVENW